MGGSKRVPLPCPLPSRAARNPGGTVPSSPCPPPRTISKVEPDHPHTPHSQGCTALPLAQEESGHFFVFKAQPFGGEEITGNQIPTEADSVLCLQRATGQNPFPSQEISFAQLGAL